MVKIFLSGCLKLGISAPDCKQLERQRALQMGLAVTLQLLKLVQLTIDHYYQDASFSWAG